MPLAAGAGAHSQPRWSPDGDRLAYISTAEGGRPQLFVRWMASGEAVRITGLPDAPSSIAWSPDGRQIAYSMFVPDEGMRLGAPLTRPEGAQWAEPLQVITAVTYRADGQGYIRPGYDQIFLVSADGGAPRQLSFGAYQQWRAAVLDAATGAPCCSAATATRIGSATGSTPKSMRSTSPRNQIRALTDRDGPDAQPAVSPDGRLIAYTGFDDRGRGYENALLYVMNARRLEPARADRRRSTAASNRRSGPATAAASTSPMTIMARPGSRGSASTARSAPSPKG